MSLQVPGRAQCIVRPLRLALPHSRGQCIGLSLQQRLRRPHGQPRVQPTTLEALTASAATTITTSITTTLTTVLRAAAGTATHTAAQLYPHLFTAQQQHPSLTQSLVLSRDPRSLLLLLLVPPRTMCHTGLTCRGETLTLTSRIITQSIT